MEPPIIEGKTRILTSSTSPPRNSAPPSLPGEVDTTLDMEMSAIVAEFDMQPVFQRAAWRKGPQTWGGRVCQALEELIREGFFKHPNKRTLEHVAKALESKGLLTKGKEDKITSFLARRVKKGSLKKFKVSNRWFFWTERFSCRKKEAAEFHGNLLANGDFVGFTWAKKRKELKNELHLLLPFCHLDPLETYYCYSCCHAHVSFVKCRS